jgi:hypothetical protein
MNVPTTHYGVDLRRLQGSELRRRRKPPPTPKTTHRVSFDANVNRYQLTLHAALPPTPLPRPSVLLETLSRAQPHGLLATPTADPSRLPAVASSSAVVPAASMRGAIPRPDDIFAPEAVAPPPPSIPPSRPRRHPTPPLFAVPVPAVKREELPMPLDALTSPVASVQDVKPVMHTPVSLPRGPAKRAKEHFVQGSSRAPLPALGTMGPPATASSGASNNTALATTAGGMPASSSSRAAKTSGDYSAYKGRGRYGRARYVLCRPRTGARSCSWLPQKGRCWRHHNQLRVRGRSGAERRTRFRVRRGCAQPRGTSAAARQ